MPSATLGETSESDQVLAAALLASDLVGLGGAVITGRFGGDSFVALLRQMLGPQARYQRLPCRVPDDRLLGGLDLVATKAQGRTVVEPGLLSRTNGGLLVLTSADRVGASTAARIVSAMDNGAVHLARDGIVATMPAQFGLIAVDTSDGSGGCCPESLKDRLAFWLPDELTAELPANPPLSPDEVLTARGLISQIEAPQEIVEVLVTVAVSLGIRSLRAPLLALRAARAHAALCGRTSITSQDAALAARLVLGPRATQIPDLGEARSESQPADQPSQSPANHDAPDISTSSQPTLDEATEVVLAAAKAALPSGLLQRLADRQRRPSATPSKVGAGDKRKSASHGRQIGHAPGRPTSGARLDLLATIRAAAPWQLLRQRERQIGLPRAPSLGRLIDIRPSDFRIAKFESRTEAVTVFVVDASGSSALNRLAEAKGAVELLLADCYVRRDQVAMIAFRQRAAEVLLPPTRSLTRARRVLAELGGGGATPLASGLTVAREMVVGIRGRGQTALCLLLTDGQANIDINGAAGRSAAEADALRAAGALCQAAPSLIVIDTAVRPRPFAAQLAGKLSARYIVLPNADASALSQVAREASARGPR